MPTSTENVCFLSYFGSPVSRWSGPFLTQSRYLFPQVARPPGSFFDGEKPPPACDPLEDMRTSIRAFHSRAGDQVLHRAGEKNLPRVGPSGYAGTDVHSDSSHVIAFNYALAGV